MDYHFGDLCDIQSSEAWVMTASAVHKFYLKDCMRNVSKSGTVYHTPDNACHPYNQILQANYLTKILDYFHKRSHGI